jgi:hypothetical protein
LFYLGLILNTFILSFLAGSFNGAVYGMLKHQELISGTFYENAWIAALPTNEPFIMKFVPVIALVLWGFSSTLFLGLCVSMVVVYLLFFPGTSPYTFFGLVLGVPTLTTVLFSMEFYNTRFRCTDFLNHRWTAGIAVGLSAGTLELYTRNLFPGEFHLLFWEMPKFHPGQIAPVLLHIVTGTIIVGTVLTSFSTENDWDWKHIVAAFVCASVIHWVWNTWFLTQMWFWGPLTGGVTP